METHSMKFDPGSVLDILLHVIILSVCYLQNCTVIYAYSLLQVVPVTVSSDTNLASSSFTFSSFLFIL